MSQQKLEQFKAEVRKCLDRAGKMYGLEEQMKNVDIRLDIRGYRVAGMACRKGFVNFSLRFHPDAILKHWDEMVDNTIPHEVAHTVCQMNPTLGKNHDAGWKRVCRALGGDDSRTHTLEFGEKPTRKECWYRTTAGELVDIGPIRHAKVQKGATYNARGKGKIQADGYVGNTKPGASQPEPQLEQAARTQAPKQKTVSKSTPKTQSGSKAEQARAYIQNLIEAGQSQEQLLTDKGIHAKHLHVALGFGTLGAARSCFVANTNKLFK
jgi:predicted SprT family Zn-dependent metalloprotease